MKKGFTLIELLVVVAIMGILTMITVSQFTTARQKAHDVQRKADLSALRNALLMYYADYSVMPDSSPDGRVIVQDHAIAKVINWGEEFSDSAATPYVYMKVMPKENKSDFPSYYYEQLESGKGFALYAALENEVDEDCRKVDGNPDLFRFSKGGGLNNYCLVFTSPNVDPADL